MKAIHGESTLNVSDALNNMEQLITQAKERKRDPLRMKKSLDKAEKTAIIAKELIEKMFKEGLIDKSLYDKSLARYNPLYRELKKWQELL